MVFGRFFGWWAIRTGPIPRITHKSLAELDLRYATALPGGAGRLGGGWRRSPPNETLTRADSPTQIPEAPLF